MSDISKLNSIRPQTPPVAQDKTQAGDEKLREVSDLYENYFIREMMKQMRSTVQESDFIKHNNAEKIFRDQLDDQYADQWGKAGGIGLSAIIYDQLMQRYGEKMGLKEKIEKPHGPIELNQKSNYSGFTSDTSTFKFETSPAQRTSIQNPWAGTLLDKKYLEMDQVQYRIQHDNGLESLISARGTGLGSQSSLPTLSLGDKVQAGQQLGWASAASPLFWTVKPNVSE